MAFHGSKLKTRPLLQALAHDNVHPSTFSRCPVGTVEQRNSGTATSQPGCIDEAPCSEVPPPSRHFAVGNPCVNWRANEASAHADAIQSTAADMSPSGLDALGQCCCTSNKVARWTNTTATGIPRCSARGVSMRLVRWRVRFPTGFCGVGLCWVDGSRLVEFQTNCPIRVGRFDQGDRVASSDTHATLARIAPTRAVPPPCCFETPQPRRPARHR